MYINRYAGPIPLTASHLYSDEKPQKSTSGIIQTYPFFLNPSNYMNQKWIWTAFYGLSSIKVTRNSGKIAILQNSSKIGEVKLGQIIWKNIIEVVLTKNFEKV